MNIFFGNGIGSQDEICLYEQFYHLWIVIAKGACIGFESHILCGCYIAYCEINLTQQLSHLFAFVVIHHKGEGSVLRIIEQMLHKFSLSGKSQILIVAIKVIMGTFLSFLQNL